MNKKIIFFIILVLLLGIVFLKKKTKFTEFIRLESDFYIPKKDNIIDFKQKSINAHRICIYDDSDPNNVDLECINANELITTLNLPPQRKNQVCIDNKCLTKEDLQIMNGNKRFKLKSKASNILGYDDMCMYNGSTTSNLCGQRTIRIHTMMPTFCNNPSSINFTLEKGGNRDENLQNYGKKLKMSANSDNEKPGHHIV